MSMVPRARDTMDMGVGYNGHVYKHVVRTSYVNQPIFNSEMKNKKVIFKCRNLYFVGSDDKKKTFSEEGAPWTRPWCPKTCPLYPVHGAPA